jgi:hypothetical protein
MEIVLKLRRFIAERLVALISPRHCALHLTVKDHPQDTFHKPKTLPHIQIIYRWIIFIDVAPTTEDYAYYILTLCRNYVARGIGPVDVFRSRTPISILLSPGVSFVVPTPVVLPTDLHAVPVAH